jgi:FMN phosphatase YigB (HAD superfamily)
LSTPRPVAALVWDLDGTLYRSTAACRHYARGISATLDADRRGPYLEAVERFLGGGTGVDAADGWEAAVVLAGGERGASRAFGDAFASTRAFMLTDECDLEIPEGVRELLERSESGARRVLMSNTPAYGVMPLLDRLGALGLFDEIVCDSGKPYRFDVRLRGLADTLDIACEGVLSIGDHFVNDIEPALAVGCTTAYVDPFGVGPRGKAHLEGSCFEELLEPIEDWLEAR